jgi:regulator of sigma E protease
MLSILGFLITLAPLVIVHEFGHYIFARIFNVKAEIFSIGFGPRLWNKQLGETELRVSLIPLGGYVKLLGEDRESQLSPEDQKRALHRQAPWKRFFIFFGGPLFNFLWAILVFMAILAIGEPQIGNTVGRVVKDSPAAHAGFESGDKLVTLEGNPVRHFEDFMNVVNDNPGKALVVQVEHAGSTQLVDLKVTPSSEDGYSMYGESTQVGDIDGLIPSPRAAEVGVSDPNSLAEKAGFKTGDLITELNGTPVKSWEALETIFARSAPGTAFHFKVEKSVNGAPATGNGKGPTAQIDLIKPLTATGTLASAWGLYSSELFIEKVVPQSPAAQAGITPGDRVIAVGGAVGGRPAKRIESFFDLKDEVQAAGDKDGKIQVQWERDGKTQTAFITPTTTQQRNAVLKATKQYTIGIMPMLVMTEPVMVTDQIWNPFTLVWKGTERMVVFSWRNMVSIGKMFSGDVSVATLGGPIMIGKIAGESLARGLIEFLTTMAVLSIGLGVLNVLPIPVLDGGHLVLLAIETVRGKPLALRTMEIIQGVGLSAILLLMVIVLKNDLTRLPFFN